MKKIIFPILMLTFIASTTFAGPFGLSKGMSVEEISKLSEKGYEPTSPDNDDRYLFVPKKKHEVFKIYIAFIDQEKGLYSIRAVSEEIKTNDYGTELKNVFSDMVDRLSKIYGKPKIIDKINSDSHFKEDKHWMYTLGQGARTLAAGWIKGEKDTNLPEELDSVAISVKADYHDGYLILEYNFSNSAEIEEKQDDVL
ncbi:MAG: hypothetical protein IKN62_02285 [Elusimicrobia bacterium]|nr:hypothetical protein [Elusimicrobiota bacterium]